jgi:hypothetical protein
LACSGYDFETRGVYEAPLSKLRVEVAGRGHVKAGEDVTDLKLGFAQFCPLPGGAAAAVVVTFPGGASGPQWEVQSPTPVRAILPWNVTHLEGQLRLAGHKTLDAAELAESARTVEGALGGPKGIVLGGQSARLRVLSTRFSRERARAAAPTPCGSL